MPQPKTSRSKPESRQIVRQTDTAWWCPVCDNAQLHGQLAEGREVCAGCGAVRDGDKVTPDE